LRQRGDNQIAFLKAIKEGRGKIVPVGQKAIESFGNLEGTDILNLIDKSIRINDEIKDIANYIGRGF
jgi:hypothetical protein